MMGAKTLEAQIADGTAKVEGDVGILAQLASTMVDFDPRFEIMPGTKARTTRSCARRSLRGGARAVHCGIRSSSRVPGVKTYARASCGWRTVGGKMLAP